MLCPTLGAQLKKELNKSYIILGTIAATITHPHAVTVESTCETRAILKLHPCPSRSHTFWIHEICMAGAQEGNAIAQRNHLLGVPTFRENDPSEEVSA